jgi:Protein of unknown function (DUF2605)
MTSSPSPADAAGLLESLLTPLLEDFDASFHRGLQLLELCPDRVLNKPARDTLRERLQVSLAELQAARALRAAAPVPMALDMAAIAPWHALLVEVWSLSAALRAAGVKIERPDGSQDAVEAQDPGSNMGRRGAPEGRP